MHDGHVGDLVVTGGETLEGGRDVPPRRRTRWALGLAVVLVVGLVLADRTVREREVDTLLSDVENVSAAVSLADQRVTAMQLYIRPASSSSATSPELAADLDELVAEAAATGSEELRARGREVGSRTVLPWHHDVRDAQDALARYADARADRLQGGAEPGPDLALAPAVEALRAALGPSARLDDAIATLPGGRR